MVGKVAFGRTAFGSVSQERVLVQARVPRRFFGTGHQDTQHSVFQCIDIIAQCYA